MCNNTDGDSELLFSDSVPSECHSGSLSRKKYLSARCWEKKYSELMASLTAGEENQQHLACSVLTARGCLLFCATLVRCSSYATCYCLDEEATCRFLMKMNALAERCEADDLWPLTGDLPAPLDLPAR